MEQSKPPLIKVRCDMIGCERPPVRMYQLAPGTTVWLCDECVKRCDLGTAANA